MSPACPKPDRQYSVCGTEGAQMVSAWEGDGPRVLGLLPSVSIASASQACSSGSGNNRGLLLAQRPLLTG